QGHFESVVQCSAFPKHIINLPHHPLGQPIHSSAKILTAHTSKMHTPSGRPEHTVDAVYGITRDIPLNYTPRPSVDELLIENLTREKHIIIYGSSKQGKTSLRKHCLKDTDYITVQCASRWTLEEILSNILKRAGFLVA